MAAAVGALAAEGKARVDRLLLDGRPIAAAVTLRSGETAWTWKIAYDESHARASPGVQLMHDLTESLLADHDDRARGFLRHRRSSDDRSHVARAPCAGRSADRGATGAGGVCGRVPPGDSAPLRVRRGKDGA